MRQLLKEKLRVTETDKPTYVMPKSDELKDAIGRKDAVQRQGLGSYNLTLSTMMK